MLTTDLVRATRRAGELKVTRLKGKQRERAEQLAVLLLQTTRDAVGKSRDELGQDYAELGEAPNEKKLVAGLIKLIDDASEFESPGDVDARRLRREVFLRASTARREGAFRREAVLEDAARSLELDSALVDSALFADLRAAQVLKAAPAMNAAGLVERYDLAQVQAVLLRAIRIRCEVLCTSADAYRDLFRKLKFRRLLYTLQPLPDKGYEIVIDGPMSLFESATKYGLQLALVLPGLLTAKRLKLEAELRWGKERRPTRFVLEQKRPRETDDAEVRLPDEVERLKESFERLGSAWSVNAAEGVVNLPGIGVCVPDLMFEHESKTRVLLEVLGYWSRDAVWRRVEMVQQGLGERWLFAVSQRLRVSEAVLDEVESSALYVYKGTMSARSVLDRLERLRRG